MKIFNWVHRMLNHKDRLAQNARKSGVTASKSSDDIDNQFVLENSAFSGVFDGWKGGILAIGTFGYDPLKDENEEHDEFLYKLESEKQQLSVLENESDHQITDSEGEEEEEEEEEEDEEVNPLVYAAYAHDYKGLLDVKMEGNRVEFEFDAMMKNTKKMRTTLAELFCADSEEMQKKQPINKGEIIKEKSNYKHRLSFAKKLTGDDARPIHKLHRLMRRMLKRKIHPDLGLNYKHSPINSKVETSESASLLPIQDAII